jgi:hypothetical protein
MKNIQSVRPCDICNRPTVHFRQDYSPNHILHLLLSIVSGGLWIPVWILLSVFAPNPDPVCSNCGGIMPEEKIAELKALSFGDKWKRFFGWKSAKKV